jgi:hypothetical protein
MTVTLPSPYSVRSESAAAVHWRLGSSAKARVPSIAVASVGRSVAYLASPTGASTLSPSMPPPMKTLTRTRSSLPAALAMPASRASMPRREPP